MHFKNSGPNSDGGASMNILLTGGTGFVGQALTASLLKNGHDIAAIGQSRSHLFILKENFRYISADTTKEGPWQEEANTADIIINLTGTNIFRYWTPGNKKKIYDSRVLTTRHLVNAISKEKNVTLINASAAGYYGDRKDDAITEEETPGNDFLAQVCVDWEKEAFRAEEKNARVVTMRFGVVLGKNGGALSKMVIPYHLYLGGPLGKGIQWFPWIHMDDLVRAVILVMDDQMAKGPVNFVSPSPVRQKDFAKALGKVLNKPALMPAPAPIIRMVMGELGKAFLSSQRVLPEKLSDYHFEFKFPELSSALEDCLLMSS